MRILSHAVVASSLFLSAQTLAQSNTAATTEAPLWVTLLVNAFPILLLIAVYVVVMKIYAGWSQKQFASRYQQHLERIDQSLQRIADALEQPRQK